MPMLKIMEYKKALLYIGGLMVAAGGPISLFSASDLVASAKRSWFATPAAVAASAPQKSASTEVPIAPDASPVSRVDIQPSYTPSAGNASSNLATAIPSTSLAEALNFDVTVNWVMGRWSRVSTGLPYLQLQGYRVTLVTGTSVADLAGSLTYYFNAQQRVQRITFRGTTGDPSVLANFLTSRFRFARRLTNDPGIVLYEAVDSSNQLAGSLKIRSARVIKADQPYTRFELDLVMDRPDR